MFDYPVTLNPDGGTVLVTFADVPEAITFGADEDEALLNAVDALKTGLSFYVDARLALPAVSKPARGRKTVARWRWSAPNWGVSGNDRAGHQKGRTGPPFGLAHASG